MYQMSFDFVALNMLCEKLAYKNCQKDERDILFGNDKKLTQIPLAKDI